MPRKTITLMEEGRWKKEEGRVHDSRVTLFVHILCMASIDHCDSIAIDCIGEVPLIGICHVVACPLRDGWLATEEGALYLKHGVIGVMHVLLHQLLRIGMLIFLGHIAIEGCYLLCATFPNNMLHNFAYSSLTAANVISRASSIVIVSWSSSSIC